MSDTLHIRSLEILDFKRIKAATIKPDGSPQVIVGGRNGQGKSSVLDSILSTLGGASCDPAEPVRKGGKRAEVTIDLGEYRVTMTHTGKTRSLKVTRPDGAVMPKAQTVLDGLLGAHTVDPVAWLSEAPKQQADTLRKLAGIDTADLDEERTRLYEERTLAGREAKALRARADAKPIGRDPVIEVTVSELVKQLDAANKTEAAAAAAAMEVSAIQRRVDQLVVELRDLEARLKETKAEADGTLAALALAEFAATKAAAAVIDPTPIRAAMENAEATNKAARDYAEAKRLAAEADQAEANHAGIESRMAEIDQERAARIQAGTYPVEGLSIGEAGVLFNGLPLEQASGAERLRVAVAVALAEKPRLRVLRIRDGSLLDRDSLGMLAGLAVEHDAQVWIERVGDQDPGAIIIEDGEVYSDE